MIFAIFMIAAAVAATIFVGMFGGGLWGALAFSALLILIYRAFTDQSAPTRSLKSNQLNAFQQPLAEKPAQQGRAGYRNKAYRKHFRRKMQG